MTLASAWCRYRIICSSIVLLLLVLQGGCANTSFSKSFRGEHADIVGAQGERSYSTLAPMDHYRICLGLISLQRYSEFDRCLAPLAVRAANNEEFTDGVVTHSPDSVDILLASLEARKFIDLGQIEKAREAATRGLAATRKDPHLRMNGMISMSTAILTLGTNNPNAKGSYFRSTTDRQLLVEPYGMMAVTAALAGDEATAGQYRGLLMEAYQASGKDQTDNGLYLDEIRYWVARSHYLQGQFDAAFDMLTRDDRSALAKVTDATFSAAMFVYRPLLDPMALALYGTTFEGTKFSFELPTRVMEARSAYKSGHMDHARKHYDELLGERRISNFSGIHFRLIHERALIALHDRDPAAAEQYLRKAIEMLESQRAQLEQESYRMGFIGDKVNAYADLVDLLFEQERFTEAFEVAERAKARALVDLLASRKALPLRQQDDGDSAALMLELEKLEQDSLQHTADDMTGAATRSARRQTLNAQLQERAPELASLVTVRETRLNDVQSRLGDDELLLEYYGHDDALYAFLVSRESVHGARLNGAGLDLAVSHLRQTIQTPQAQLYRRPTRKMYDRLLRPLESRLKGRQLTVVPHGPLHYLPFAALHDGRRYLVDRFDLRLLPSAAVLQFLATSGTASGQLFAMGNPDLGDPQMDLPGAERETRVIDHGWGSSKVLLRQLASEANFKQFAPGFRYLHLASHGEFNTRFPLKSRMLLAPGDGEDGNLTVDELYGLSLNADLVTLSACETGLGNIRSGDDVIGLTRGFLYAGSRAIVASLWPVADDATAYLMQRFYAELQHKPRAQALRAALLHTKTRYPHPVFWAAFNLTGAS